MPYHTRSTVPPCVRPEVFRAWESLWRRLRRMSEQDRRLEFESGTVFRVGCVEYVIRYGPLGRALLGPWGFHVRTRRWASAEKCVEGSCAFGTHKPYTHLDRLQDALDELIAEEVMDA